MRALLLALRSLIGAVVVAGLTACGAPPIPDLPARGPEPVAALVEGCCRADETYPDWVIRIADANVETLRDFGQIQLRPGRMTRQVEATGIILEALQPLDVIFVHSENRMSGHLIPGQFTHGAIHIGTEAQLRAAGLWHMPELAPYHDQIREGRIFLEAVDGGVRLAPPEIVLDTDAVVLLRPESQNRAAILRRGLARMGVPFDMRFDSADPSQLFCAELISLMYPAADLPRSTAYGRETILIDAIVASALTGDIPFGLVGYVEATPGGGSRALSARDLAWRLRQAWAGVGN